MPNKTLGEVAKYINGRGFKPTEWEKVGKPIIRIQNLTDSSQVCNRTTQDYDEKYHIRDGDLLFAWSASLGAHIWHGEDGWLNQHIFKVLPNDGMNKMYLYYYLIHIVDQLKAKTHGSGMVHITAKPFKETPIYVPTLDEQQYIVERIESLFAKLDEAKDKAQAAVDGFETFKEAILQRAFSGELTANWREIHNVDMDDWERVTLSDVCEINPSKGNMKDLPDDLEVSFFPMPALSEIYGAITDPQTRLLKDVQTGYTNFLEGDVVFAKITPCMENGKSAVIGKLVNDIGFGTTEFFVLRCGEKLFNRYLHHMIRSQTFRDKAKVVMTGAVGQQRVPRSYLAQYQINLPSILEQKEIVRNLDDLLAKEQQAKEAAEAVLDRIDTMKTAILAHAFRGERGTDGLT